MTQNLYELARIDGLEEEEYRRFNNPHPFDTTYGIDTSGYLPRRYLYAKDNAFEKNYSYVATQPSIIRKAIEFLPRDFLPKYSFIDIGCGKGRVLVTATEYPFKSITGIELSSELLDICDQNALRVRSQYPDRTPIVLRQMDGRDFKPCDHYLILFFYCPFDEEGFLNFFDKVKSSLEKGEVEHLFLIFHNPLHFKYLDESPLFKRWMVKVFECEPEEKPCAYELEAVTAIWQSMPSHLESNHPNRNTDIIKPYPFSTRLAKT